MYIQYTYIIYIYFIYERFERNHSVKLLLFRSGHYLRYFIILLRLESGNMLVIAYGYYSADYNQIDCSEFYHC